MSIHCPLFPQDYLDMVGLSVMFPRVEVFLIQGSPVDMLERPPMDGERGNILYAWVFRKLLKMQEDAVCDSVSIIFVDAL